MEVMVPKCPYVLSTLHINIFFAQKKNKLKENFRSVYRTGIHTRLDHVLGVKRYQPHRLMEMTIINLQRVEFKHTPKKFCLSILLKFHCSNTKWYSVVCMVPMCLYVCLRISGHASNETGGVLGDIVPDLDQGLP